MNDRGGRMRWLAVAVLLGCVFAYGLGLHGPLFFDDAPNLLDNPQVQIDGRDFDDWRVAALSSDAGALLRPVAMLSFALNHVLAGAFTPFSLKATNLVVHLLNGALLYLFALAVLQTPALRARQPDARTRQWIALLAAALWLLHPIHVSTVLYTVQRMAQLSALFSLLGLAGYTRYRLRWAEHGAGTGDLIAAALWLLLCAVLAVLSKENGALLPWLLAVVEVTLFRGVWRGQARRPLVGTGMLCLLLPLLLLVAVTVWAPAALPGSFANRDFTLPERLLTQGRVLWQYLAWMLLPNILDMGFFHDDMAVSRGLFAPVTTALALLAWGVVLAVCVWWRSRYPLLVFAFLFYLVAHAMESTVLPLELVFEHRNYLPAAGFAVLAAAGMVDGARRVRGLRWSALAAGVLVVLFALLCVRTYMWRDEAALARFEVINHPHSARANFLYANALYKQFIQAQAAGADEAGQRALAVTSRRYFERMYALDTGSYSALVMLYQLDTNYFPALAVQNDWLGRMLAVAQARRLRSSDRTALAALVNFALSPAGEPDRDRIALLLDRLAGRYPRSLELFGYRYRIAKAAGREHSPAMLAELQRLAQSNPREPQAASYLAQYYGSANLGETYEAIRNWMRFDVYRRELPVIQEIFEQ